MATTYVYRTGTMAGGSRTTWTLSMWVKFYADQTYRSFFSQSDNTDDYTEIKMHTGDYIHWENAESVMNAELKTTPVFRDPTAWYNIIFVWDTTNDTSGDRMRIYVNGDRITSFLSETQPPEDTTGIVNKAGIGPMILGATDYSGSAPQKYWNGNMSNVQFVDGAALAPTEFGEVDSTSGIWKLKTAAYSTPGTNGFFLKMEDRTNLDLDSSSNAHTFATSGTGTATYDNPSNNFCTMNPLDNYYCGATLSNGNNSLVTGSSPYAQISSTLAASAGKWYWEVKPTAGNYWLIGAASSPAISTSDHAGYSAYSNAVYYSNGNNYVNNVSSAYAASYTTNDIISVALDLDNNKLYYAKNGAWGTGSGAWDSTTFNAAVGAITITAPASTKTGIYFPVVSDYTGSGTATFQCNFGNGYFGTTAVASTNADDAGIGSFEYDVPTGFYALCTKNIITYG